MKRINVTILLIAAVTLAGACRRTEPPRPVSGVGEISAAVNGQMIVYGYADGFYESGAFGMLYDREYRVSEEVFFPAFTFTSTHTNIINASQGRMAQLFVNVPGVTGPGEFDIVALGGQVMLIDSRFGPEEAYIYGIGEGFPGSSGTLYIDEVGPRVGDMGRLAKGSILGTAFRRKPTVTTNQPEFAGTFEVIFNQELSF